MLNGKPASSGRASTTATAADAAESTNAWSASPARSGPLPAPVAFITAKSLARSRAERYTIEPMIPAAMSQRRALMKSIVCSPLAIGRRMSATTSALVSCARPSGVASGLPLVTTAVASG